MEDFLWHKISEKEKKEIEKQAKKIIDGFSKKILKIKKDVGEPVIERGEGVRNEGSGDCCEMDREIMFENAPNKNGDFIVGEKKEW